MLKKLFNILFRIKQPVVEEVWKHKTFDTFATILSVANGIVYYRTFNNHQLTYDKTSIENFLKDYKFSRKSIFEE